MHREQLLHIQFLIECKVNAVIKVKLFISSDCICHSMQNMSVSPSSLNPILIVH